MAIDMKYLDLLEVHLHGTLKEMDLLRDKEMTLSLLLGTVVLGLIRLPSKN